MVIRMRRGEKDTQVTRKPYRSRVSDRRRKASIVAASAAAWLAVSATFAFTESKAPDAFANIQAANKHVRVLELALTRLHLEWLDVNEKSVATQKASAAALEAAGKCQSGNESEIKGAQSQIDRAAADLKVAESDTAEASMIEAAIVADAQYTVDSLEEQNPSATNYATFAKLRASQVHFPWVAMASRTGLDPSDDPITGLGLLSASRANLRDARAALAKCGGHAAATGATPERLASRSER